jgi:hypothetical protein
MNNGRGAALRSPYQENDTMTFRTSALAASAVALALVTSAAAQAGTRTGGIPFTSNSVTANNIAAGIGNTAQQGVFANQFGASPYYGRMMGGGGVPSLRAPMGGSNSVTANNIAAGINNTAIQGVGAMQGPGGNNRVDATNLAAGLGNFASQQVLTTQR